MQKLLFLSLCGVLSFFLYELWYGQGSIYDCYHLQKVVAEAKDKNQVLIDRNNAVQDKLLELKGSDELIEISSRRQYGLVKNGETLINFPSDKSLVQNNESAMNWNK